MSRLELKEKKITPFKLEDYDVSWEYGFLPIHPPVQSQLPEVFGPLQETVALLPKWLSTGKIRQIIEAMPEVTVNYLSLGERRLRRLMQIYAYLAHAYVWGQQPPAGVLPRNIAVPFHQIAQTLSRPPVLSYASYAMDNWVRIDQTRPVEIGNIRVVQNFLGGLDEDWFILIHIDIEAKAAPALAAIPIILQGIVKADVNAVSIALEQIKQAWLQINAAMGRMGEGCDPYIYYNRVRPFIHGWKNNSALPVGLIYDGVAAYGGDPQQFRGETGAQSGVVPTMDALFNIVHKPDPLRAYLLEMRDYMPPQHRAFVEAVESRSTLREFVKDHMDRTPKLKALYNDCVSLIDQFRTLHLDFAARYIHQQTAKASNDPNVGTGGTPFMGYLEKHRDECRDRLLK